MVLFWATTPTMKSFCQVSNCFFSIEETGGFCYGAYYYNDKEYKVCYGRPNMPKTAFHFADDERKCFILLSKRHSQIGMNNRTLIFDINNNIVQEIDSCFDNNSNNRFNCKEYIATSGDTVYVANTDKKHIRAYLFSKQMMPTISDGKKCGMLKMIAHIQDINTWCVSKSNKRLAYKRNEEDSITVILETETVKIPSGFAEVLAWKDENHLLYTKIKVKGTGDFFYDLFEYNVQEKKSNLVLKDLLDVYDYYNNLLLYSTSHNILTLTRLNGVEPELQKQLDLSTQLEWIYSAYIINDGEVIIGGDKNQTDCHYFKCTFPIPQN